MAAASKNHRKMAKMKMAKWRKAANEYRKRQRNENISVMKA